jgi:riboflavin kinase/FMN adenylyltransferase
MQIIKGFKHLPPFSKNCVVAIGNFDGIHLGHQKILQIVVREAKKTGLHSLLLTFSPHPEKVLGSQKVKMIQTLDQRLSTIEKFQVQHVVVLPFTKKLADIPAKKFVRTIVLQKLNAKKVIVGENFRFGQNREGDITKLKDFAEEFNFEVRSIAPVVKEGNVVSSSLIREFLQRGKIEKANNLIGRPYEIEGTVIKGKSRGKQLGFPTANVHPLNEIIPTGVFVSKVGIGSRLWFSVTHVGSKPTFNDKDKHIESYIINFKKDLYGERFRIFFLRKLRVEKKFETPEALSLQIRKDLEAAMKYFRLKNSRTVNICE